MMPVTTGEAAERLGVSAHEVRRLVASGDLAATRAGRTILVDDAAVRARLRSRTGRGRALAPATAWAALLEASGERAAWLERSTKSRLRRWLRERDPELIAVACRRRAERRELNVLPTYDDAVMSARGVVTGGISAADQLASQISDVGAGTSEMYCSRHTLDALTRDFGLTGTGRPNLIVRIPTFDDASVLGRPVMPVAVVAVDMSESADARTRRAGLDILTKAIRDHLR
jgi:excisionase family DNA binding protein